MSLTDRQREILRVIHRQTAKRGFPPSVRELGCELNVHSTNGVREHLMALARKGYVKQDMFTARSIRLTAKGEEAIDVADPQDELEKAARQALGALEGVLTGHGQFRFIEAHAAVDALRLAGVR